MSNEQAIAVQQNQNLSVIDVSNIEIQIRAAQIVGRNEKKAMENAIAVATRNNESAMACVWIRPVGKKNGSPVFETGGSIRAAELVVQNMKNIRMGASIIDELEPAKGKPGYIMIRAGMWDTFANNQHVEEASRVWHYGVQRDVVIEAAKSIAYRTLVSRCLGRSYIDEIAEACYKKIVGSTGKELEAAWNSVISLFKMKGIEEQQVRSKLSIKGDPSPKQIFEAIGIIQYIKESNDPDAELASIFMNEESAPTTATKKPDISGTTKAAAPKASQKQEPNPEAKLKQPKEQPKPDPKKEPVPEPAPEKEADPVQEEISEKEIQEAVYDAEYEEVEAEAKDNSSGERSLKDKIQDLLNRSSGEMTWADVENVAKACYSGKDVEDLSEKEADDLIDIIQSQL